MTGWYRHQRGPGRAVLTVDADRLHRNVIELEAYIDACEPVKWRPTPSRPASST